MQCVGLAAICVAPQIHHPEHTLSATHSSASVNCQMASRAFAALALVASCAAAPLGREWRSLPASAKQLYTYEHFAVEFSKDGSAGSRSRFQAELARVVAHNAQNLSWTEGINQFSDMTGGEFAQYKGKVFNGVDVSHMKYDSGVATKDLPAEIDWRDATKNPSKGVAVTPVKNQGGCGSCWAFSSTESVESAVFMQTGKLPVLAPQEFVDCIPNPNSCGGTGGCAGSTEEYGFAYSMLYGMAADSTYNYTAKTGKACLLNEGGRVPIGKSESLSPVTSYCVATAAEHLRCPACRFLAFQRRASETAVTLLQLAPRTSSSCRATTTSP